MLLELIAPSFLSFLIVLIFTPRIINYFKDAKIVSRDVHKVGKPLIPNSSGIPVILGVFIGLFFYIFIKVFLFREYTELIVLLASMLSILMITFVGFVDDINSSQVKVAGYIEGKKGLKRWQKPLLTLPAALPLMVIAAGTTTVNLPFVGVIDLGVLYPLVIVPLGIVGASNMVNMLGGLNGLEAGMGLVYTFSLGLFSLLKQSIIASLLFFTVFSSLLAILKYNKYPARILAGDSLTYLLGATIAVGAIIGNIERAAIVVMTPFIIQGILKFYSLFKLKHFASDLGILQKDGTIKSKYGKNIYSLTHFVMNLGKFNEKQIVFILVLIQLVFAVIPFLNIF
ncbi:MAG: hypothetical protein QW818_01690 [Candidatus Aenigmatarchaeota archaeon]|nr:hypothetical protein [Candidatus Aenigmarchaeota archaeon]